MCQVKGHNKIKLNYNNFKTFLKKIIIMSQQSKSFIVSLPIMDQAGFLFTSLKK